MAEKSWNGAGRQRSPVSSFSIEGCTKEFMDKISMVDKTLTSLANSVDILHAAACGSAGYSDESSLQDDEKGFVTIQMDTYKPASPSLLYLVEKTVLSEKNLAVKSAYDLLCFVLQNISLVSDAPAEKIPSLSLGNYLVSFEDTNTTSGFEDFEKEYSCFEEDRNRLLQHMKVLLDYEKVYKSEIEVIKERTDMLEENKGLLETKTKEAEEIISQLNKEINTLVRVNSGLTKSNNDLKRKSNTNQNIQNQLERFKREKSLAEREHEQFRTAAENSLEFYKEELKKITRESANKQHEIDVLKKTNESTDLENDILNNAVEEKKERISSLEKKLNVASKTSEREIIQLKSEITIANDKYEAEQKNGRELSYNISKSRQREQNVSLELDRLKTKYKHLEENIEKYRQDLKAKSENEERMKQTERDQMELSKSMSELTKQNARLNADIEHKSEVIRELSSTNRLLQKENEMIIEELERIKRKKVIQVQLFYQRRGELICAIEEELMSLLKGKMESENKYEVEFIKCMNTSEVQTDKPLILLCISASRIGTDAANTIQGIKLTHKMLLLIFHHKDEHALPSQASCQILTGQEYKTMGGVLDFAFLSGKGIYNCAMNKGSITKIVSFISAEGVQIITTCTNIVGKNFGAAPAFQPTKDAMKAKLRTTISRFYTKSLQNLDIL